MAAENYERIMDHILASEGGFANHPDDPGGATNMGITIGTLRAWRGGEAVSVEDVRGLSRTEAMAIYRRNYWDKIAGDELPSGVDLCTMDGAVNSGPSRGARWLQRAIGAMADGLVGTETIAKAEAADARVTVERMCDDRLDFLKGLGTWPTFGKGWSRRVESVRALALELATQPAVSAPSTPSTAVVVAEPAKKPAVTGGPTSKATGGAVGAAIPNVILMLAYKVGLIPPEVATDPETILYLGLFLTAVGGWLGAYLAPKNAEARA